MGGAMTGEVPPRGDQRRLVIERHLQSLCARDGRLPETNEAIDAVREAGLTDDLGYVDTLEIVHNFLRVRR